jgi:hypothetical protein
MKPLLFGLLLAWALLPMDRASAFTLDTRTPVNPDGTAKFVNPDQQVDNLTAPSTKGTTPGSKSFRSGNMTFSFGVSRDDERSAFGRTSPSNNFGFNRGFRSFNRDQ